MTEKRPIPAPEDPEKSAREARLAEALRTNLARRKAQSRARQKASEPPPGETAGKPVPPKE